MEKSKLIVIAVLVVLVGAVGLMKYGEQPAPPPEPSEQKTPDVAKSADTEGTPPKEKKAPSNLQKTDIVVGKGKEAKAGQKVSVHYRGTLTDGKVFDESYGRGQPFTFNLGAGEVIKGWDLGVQGMKEGGKRKLVIPSELGYGAQGAGSDIPPNATLIFEVELLKVG